MAEPRWRNTRFGNSIELVRRRADGGPAVWLGTVEPTINGKCRYSTPAGTGLAADEDEAKRAVENLATAKNVT